MPSSVGGWATTPYAPNTSVFTDTNLPIHPPSDSVSGTCSPGLVHLNVREIVVKEGEYARVFDERSDDSRSLSLGLIA